MKYFSRNHFAAGIFLNSLLSMSCSWGATPVDLRHVSVAELQKTQTPQTASGAGLNTQFKNISSYTDFRQNQHVRLKQMYAGYEIWGADVVIHTPIQGKGKFNLLATNPQNTRMNGLMYQNLDMDLPHISAKESIAKQENGAVLCAKHLLQNQTNNTAKIINTKLQRIVYVDDKHKAHWAYYIELFAQVNHGYAQQAFIIDATSNEVYKAWNNLHTLQDELVGAGGFGGNEKTGPVMYDGLTSTKSSFAILRNKDTSICYLKGSLNFQGKQLLIQEIFDVNDASASFPGAPVKFACQEKDPMHRGLYWNNNKYNTVDNDAFYHANITNNMYTSWYNRAVVWNAGIEDEEGYADVLPIQINTHLNMANAAWIDHSTGLILGDGDDSLFPLTSLDIVAHELSHGFTQQNSNLVYTGQSGALNESFSDMAGVAASYFLTGESNWKIGSSVTVYKDALRYMDNPRHDCVGMPPYMDVGGYKIRQCSIDHVKDFKEGYASILGDQVPFVDVHYSSGIFNKVFYLLAQGWGGDKSEGTRKAFDVMVQANTGYWTPNSTFQEAACGVMEATHDYGYDESVVTSAIAAVGLDTSKC